MGFGRRNNRSAPAPAPAPRPVAAAPPPPMHQPQYQAPSMMGTMASSMAGSMAGSVIGHGVSNAMFGHGNSAQPAAPVAGTPPPAMPAPCQFETQQFLQCMSQTADNMDYCRGIFDQFKLCNAQAAMQMQQPQM